MGNLNFARLRAGSALILAAAVALSISACSVSKDVPLLPSFKMSPVEYKAWYAKVSENYLATQGCSIRPVSLGPINVTENQMACDYPQRLEMDDGPQIYSAEQVRALNDYVTALNSLLNDHGTVQDRAEWNNKLKIATEGYTTVRDQRNLTLQGEALVQYRTNLEVLIQEYTCTVNDTSVSCPGIAASNSGLLDLLTATKTVVDQFISYGNLTSDQALSDATALSASLASQIAQFNPAPAPTPTPAK